MLTRKSLRYEGPFNKNASKRIILLSWLFDFSHHLKLHVMSKLKMIATVASMILFLQSAYSQKEVSQATLKELEVAEAKMFKAMISGDREYCRDYLTSDWFSINADGSTQTREQLLADSSFGKFF